MKNAITIFLLMSVVLGLQAQDNVKTITLSYPASELNFETVDGLTSVYASGNVAYWHDTDSTMPMLPKMAANVLLEQNVEIIDVDFSAANPVFWHHVTLEGCRLPVPTDSDYNIAAHPATSSVSPSVTYMGDSEVRGHRIGTFEVFPFGYDVATGLLWICQDITMTITQRSNPNHSQSLPVATTWQCDTARQWLRDMVCNAYDVDTLDSNVNLDIVPASKRYEYLIITNNALKPEFQRLSDWKNTKGVRTKILTMEEINQSYPGLPQQQRVKSAIIATMDSTRGTLRYVLLGGDETVVPVQMAYVQVNTHINNTPCDLYYASLKELNWDQNGNGTAGELEDSVSLASDLAVMRMPVNNQINAATQINRVLDYEQKADLKPWTGKMLMVGCKISEYHHSENGDSISDAQRNGEKMYNQYIKGKWAGREVRFYDTGTDFADGAAYDVTAEHLQQQLSEGYTFVNEDTHGGIASWNMEHSPKYINADAAALNNAGSTIVLTTACNTSEFDGSTQCLAEAFLNNPQSGILAYFGDARTGWNKSNKYNGLLLNSILSDKEHLGQALSSAKNKHMVVGEDYNVFRWINMSLTGLGDAEMPVYVQKPLRFHDVSLLRSGSRLIVNEHVDSCTTCVMSMDDMGQTYYSVKKNGAGTWNMFFDLVGGPFSVCVTRDGYVPYRAQLHRSFLMQNETLCGGDELHVIADHASIGNHVTDDKPQGPVTISGNMTIQCPGGVLLDRGTSITRGARFEVKLNP